MTSKTNSNQGKRWLSPSSINTYKRCKYKFYLQYILKLKSKPNIHLIRGMIVHKVLERFFREAHTDESHYDTLRARIIQIFQDEWLDKENQLVSLNLKQQDLAFYYHDSQKMVINWLHDWLKTEAYEAAESTLEETIFSKKWMLCGRIDRIIKSRNPPLLIDYKTSKSIDTQSEDYRRQMGIYQILYSEKYNTKPATAIHFLKFQDGLREISPTKKEVEELKRTILEIHKKTRSTAPNDYPCTCGGWCKREF